MIALLSAVQHYLSINKRLHFAFVDLKKNVSIVFTEMHCGSNFLELVYRVKC